MIEAIKALVEQEWYLRLALFLAGMTAGMWLEALLNWIEARYRRLYR